MIISLPIEDRPTAPVRKPWAYLATFTDPDGHLWMVTTTD